MGSLVALDNPNREAGAVSVARSRLIAPVLAPVLLAGALAWSALVVPTPPSRAAESEAATCTPVLPSRGESSDGLVPFQSLAQGNVSDHGPPTSLLLVPAITDPIAAVVAPSSTPAVQGVDLGTNVLVGLFIGRWPREGHRVTIESVRVLDGGVCVTAVVTGPAPGQDAADAETYPYHVVTVPRDGVPQDSGTIWTAVSPDGAVIASTTSP
jgi:hypothetical protein